MQLPWFLCVLHPRKLTWQWKTNHLKMYLLLKRWISFVMFVFFGGSYFNVPFGIARSTWKSKSQSVRFRTTLGRPPRRDGFFFDDQKSWNHPPRRCPGLDGVLAYSKFAPDFFWRYQKKDMIWGVCMLFEQQLKKNGGNPKLDDDRASWMPKKHLSPAVKDWLGIKQNHDPWK